MTDGVPYDAEIEYLESTGTQWINTGFTPNADTVWFTRCEFTAYAQSKCGTAWRTGGMGFVQRADSQTMLYTRGGYHNYDTTVNPGLNPFTIELDGSHAGVKINGEWRRGQDSRGWDNTGNTEQIRLFAGYETLGTPRVLPGEMRIYVCTISVSGVLVRDYIPVRVGQVGYLFDRVTRRLYGNAGTGSFVLGPDVARPVLPARVVSVKPYDSEVEYLQGNKTSDRVGPWINTGIVPTAASDFGVEADVQWTNGNLLMNVFGEAVNGYYLLNKTSTDKQFRAHLGSWRAVYFTVDSYAARHKYKLYGANVYVDDSLVQQSSFSGDIGTVPIAIFARNEGTNVSGMSNCKVFGLKIWKSGVLVRDYIPVRVGQTGYLYDRVTRRLYGNAGTGSFVLGPDVMVEHPIAGLVPVARNVRILPYDAEVDYVESTGTQYINTGVNINSGITFFVDLQLTNTRDQQRIFSTSTKSPNAMIYVSNGKYKYSWGSAAFQTTNVSVNTNRLVIEVDAINDAITFGTYRISLNGGPLPQSSRSIINIGIEASTNTELRPYLKFYACRIFYFGSLVRDFIPVRKNGVGYLYDRANPTGGPLGNGLYGSATSTPLVAGPDK